MRSKYQTNDKWFINEQHIKEEVTIAELMTDKNQTNYEQMKERTNNE